jgi:hypothetical protein
MSWLHKLFGLPRREPWLPSDAQLARRIDFEARSGYGTAEEMAENLRLYTPTHPKLSDWLARLEAAIAEQRAREATWLEVTDNDRIDRAFAELNTRGLIALQDAADMMSDAWDVVGEHTADRPDAHGAVFFHRQDVEGAIEGGPLCLAFGAFDDGAEHEAKSLAIAREACAALKRQGIATTWNEQLEQRIELAPFPWRKRRWTKAP